jgi:hypothetical protein
MSLTHREERMLKIVLTAVSTAIVCFLIAAAMGPAARTRSDGAPTIIPAGGYFKVPSIDLSCLVFGSDPTRLDPGPVLFCNRGSVSTTKRGAASVAVSRFHITVFPSGQGAAETVARRP